ncbi:asparaginase [Streptomyces sp. SID8352]|uniref:asparaginase domain-containing protein n=1 Tax=Streptomyces sp. SID8352 TaxID=2690338 RepID=UPI00136D3D0A|nr:asparaginase [Streptomyces sp. SID8352]
MSSSLPRLLVVTLGGTIASVAAADGVGAVPRLGPAELLASVPAAAGLADISVKSFRQYASGDLSLDDIIELAELIRERADELDGFVVTQGTDTLEETSYLLELLLGPIGRPVVLTGAMRNPSLPGADGPANLLAAIRVAVSPSAAGLGPVVVFADEVHLPRFVRKAHSSHVAAFRSPHAGPIGWVTEDRVRIPLAPSGYPAPLRPARFTRPLPTVGITKIGLGSAPLRPHHVEGLDGLIVEVFGGGHVPSTIVESLASVNESIPVVMVTRTGGGELYESTYAFPGSERDLLDRGLTSGRAFDAAKARLLLICLLASGAQRPDIKERFDTAL